MNPSIRTQISMALCGVVSTAALCFAVSTCVEAEDAPTKTVRFRDLDITKPEGATILYSRIRAAARDVCELYAGSDPIERMAIKACIDKAVDKAVRDVNAPALTALRFGTTDIRLASK